MTKLQDDQTNSFMGGPMRTAISGDADSLPTSDSGARPAVQTGVTMADVDSGSARRSKKSRQIKVLAPQMFKDIFQSEAAELFLRNAHIIAIGPIICLILGLLLWGAMLAKLEKERCAAEADALNDVTSYAENYAEYLAQSIEVIDQLTLQIKYEWETSHGTMQLDGPRRQEIFDFPNSAGITIVDRNGVPITSSRAFTRTQSWKDTESFKFHQRSPSDQLQIAAPADGIVSGERIVRMTRRLVDDRGAFAGMVVASVTPKYFWYDAHAPAMGIHQVQALAGTDQIVRVSTPGNHDASMHGSLFRQVPRIGAPSLLDGQQYFTDGRSRYVATDDVGSFPFFAIVGIDWEAAMSHYQANSATYRRAAHITCWTLLCFALSSMVLTAWLLHKSWSLKAIRKTYRTATEGGDEGYYTWKAVHDEDGNIVDYEILDCNESGAALLGSTKTHLVRARLFSLQHIGPYFQLLMARAVSAMQNGVYEGDINVPRIKNCTTEWIRAKMVQSKDGLAVTLRDISALKSLEKELSYVANKDRLTGLANRHWLAAYLPIALRAAARKQAPLTVMILDLDNFKNVNDTFGHSAGDQLLQAVSARLQSILGLGDHLVRCGGDEFAFILESISSELEIAQFAELIVGLFADDFSFSSRHAAIGASVGISVFPRDGSDAESLLRNADIAMYSAKAAKAEGKSKYQFYSEELYERIKRRADDERELLRGISDDQFVVYYQPRVDSLSERIVGMEALIRWIHPERGLIPPDDFIPLAETTGMILSLGELVMEKVAAQIVVWQSEGLTAVPISVNVSARQFDEGMVSELVKRCIAKHAIEPRLIEIELTESAMMGNFDLVQREIHAISALGIHMHIDDFGTGYSSLSLLHKLNLGTLKVDRTFTAQLAHGERGRIFYTAIVAMAKSLGMRVVAEGVETFDQLRILRELGCDEIQGYLFSRPVSAADVRAFLKKSVALPARTIADPHELISDFI
jgi:diguanylate cyclase (GGDEF)-like protein